MTDAWTGAAVAITLAALWSAEAFAPAFATSAGGLRRRLVHLLIGIGNAAVGLVIAIVLVSADAAAEARGWGLLRLTGAPWWLVWIAALAALDLWQYACHLGFHHVPLLWRVHVVHHTAEKLDATVALRFHMIEIAVQGLLTIPFIVALGITAPQVAAYNLVLLPVSLFHHADIRLSPAVDRLLRLVIVTPRMHWVHHSRWQPETDSNYSAVLSIWDRLFGTMRTPRRAETVRPGLDGFSPDQTGTLRGMLAMPFSAARSEHGERPSDDELEPDQPAIAGPPVARPVAAQV